MMDNLPTEVMLSILRSVECLEQLIHLTVASSRCYRIFLHHRRRIITSVVHPETLHHALAVHHTPHPRDSWPQSHWAIVEHFLNRYFERQHELSIPNEYSNLVSLCKLVSQISRFTDRYASLSIRALEGKTDVSGWQASALSITERVRLERAFLRYELYSRIFPARDVLPGHSVVNGNVQNHLFLRHLKRWELEEMCCVHQHLCVVVTEFIDDLERHTADLRRADLARDKQPMSADAESRQLQTPHENRPITLLDNKVALQNDKDTGLITLQVQNDFLFLRTKINYLVSLGLNFVDPMCAYKSDGTPRLDFIPENWPTYRQFLPQAVSRPIRNAWIKVQESNPQHDADGDSSARPNLAFTLFEWYMVGGGHLERIFGDNFYSWPAREMGHVFWDRERLRREGVQDGLFKGWSMHPHETRALARKTLKVNVLMHCPSAENERDICGGMYCLP